MPSVIPGLKKGKEYLIKMHLLETKTTFFFFFK